MIDLRKYLPRDIRGKLMYGLSFLPDAPYLKIFYFATTGKRLNLKNPQGYNEKLQWLKIHDKQERYRDLVDKLKVRDYIKEVWGEEHLFPLLGYWKSFDEIDFDSLPKQFVLKCNHDSGSTKIITDKAALQPADFAALKKTFDKRMQKDFSLAGREYPYKGIERYILAEQLMVDSAHPDKSIEDYKFFCFNGVPKIMFVATDRSTDCRFDFFDMDFNHLDIQNIHPNSDKPIAKPACFEEMKQVAAKLSAGMKTVRIDLYELNGKLYFGEFTFFHGGGFRLFYPEEWEKRLGDWVKLDEK